MAGGDYGRIRHTFWTDPEIKRGLTPGAKLLLVYYCSNAHSNLCGLYYLPLEYAALETGIALDSVREWTAGALSRFVTYDERTEEILVHGLAKHQVAETVVETDKRLPRVRKELAAAHSPALVRKFLTLYAEWPIGMQAPPEPDPVEKPTAEAPSEPLESPSEAIAVAWQGSSEHGTDTTPDGVDGQAVEVIDAEVEVVDPAEDEPGSVGVIPLRPREAWDERGDTVTASEVLAEWLKRQPMRPPAKVVAKQGAIAKRLAESCTRAQLRAAFLGMDTLFPFCNGAPWDLFRLEQRLAEAIAGAVNHPTIKQAREAAEWDQEFNQASGFW